MDYKHSCVIDSTGYYKTLVLVIYEPNEEGFFEEKIQYYTLKDGETLLDTVVPSDLVKPRWNGSEWVEGATPKEIEEWEAAHPAPPPPVPTAEQQQLAAMALKQAQQDTELAQTQQTCAMLMLQLVQTQAGGESNV